MTAIDYYGVRRSLALHLQLLLMTLLCACAPVADDESEWQNIEGMRAGLSGTALFVSSSATPSGADQEVIHRLLSLGLFVQTVSASASRTADATGKVVVVISSTVTAPSVGTKFRSVTVPVVTWESQLFDDLGMTTTSPSNFGTQSLQRNVVIAAPTHPIAAGLSGTVAVTRSGSTFNWGKPNANALRVATIASDSTRAAVFTYESGSSMPGLVAPARRVGLFLGDSTGLVLTANGIKLFEQAITWAASRPSTPGDADGDRLADSVETNTRVYVSPQDTGTDPDNPDTDGDGLLDGDEVLGTPFGLNLPALGATPLRKQILIEHDWFNDSLDCASHSHRPTAAALAQFTTAFANAPVANPDGSTGITLVHDYGQGGIFTGGNAIQDADGVLVGGVGSPEYQTYKTNQFAANRNGYFHYVIYPHRYNTDSLSSGQAEIRGDDLIVSLYCYYDNDAYVANTLMHELGHNLNLLHGGNVGTNNKPNYNSVMNYAYQFPGVDTDCLPGGDGLLDFSRKQRITLDENALREPAGICGNVRWDWNGNGQTEQTPVVEDVNDDQVFEIVDDFDDWANIVLAWQSTGIGPAREPESTVVSCDNPPPAR